jgi:hypothetical protein
VEVQGPETAAAPLGLPFDRSSRSRARFAFELFIGGEEMLDLHQPVLGEDFQIINPVEARLAHTASNIVPAPSRSIA